MPSSRNANGKHNTRTSSRPRSKIASYLWAVVVVGGVLCLKFLFLPPGSTSPSLLFFAAVMLCAWQGGLGPGWLAALLSSLALNYFFLPPYGQFSTDSMNIAQTFILFIEGAFISLLANARRRAKHHAREEWQKARDEAGRAVVAELRVLDHETLNRAVLDSLPAHIAVLDKNGTVVMVNEAWERFGRENQPYNWPRIRPGENYLQTCRETSDNDALFAMKGIRSLLAGQQPGFAMEYSCRTTQGTRWFSLTATPLVTHESAAAGAVVSHLDISERKAIEIERTQVLDRERKARAIAEDANRSKDEFLAIVSHELRTPLNSILGWVQLLGGGQLEESAARQGLHVIERNVRAQSQLINDLLDVSRIVTGKMSIEPEPLHLQHVAQNTLDIILPAAQEKELKFITDFQGDPQICGDPHRLQQVLWNLLHNAVKFSSHGQAIVLTLGETETQAYLTVSDNGIGIAPDFLPNIFDRFRQADGTATRRHGGLGLGLSISRHLVELHQGTLLATSNGPEQGAIFTVTLPLLEPTPPESPAN